MFSARNKKAGNAHFTFCKEHLSSIGGSHPTNIMWLSLVYVFMWVLYKVRDSQSIGQSNTIMCGGGNPFLKYMTHKLMCIQNHSKVVHGET